MSQQTVRPRRESWTKGCGARADQIRAERERKRQATNGDLADPTSAVLEYGDALLPAQTKGHCDLACEILSRAPATCRLTEPVTAEGQKPTDLALRGARSA